MTSLIAGLLLFLGVHSVRIFAEPWRNAQIARLGVSRWKLLYTVASIAGFALLVHGYGVARAVRAELWQPPAWLAWPASALMLVAMVLLVAAYVPGNRIKAAVGHPMILAVKVWAFAHLICNGRLVDLVVFGSFLAWAVLDFRAARMRDRATGASRPAGTVPATVATVVIGLVAWFVFARYLHAWLIGVAPFAVA